MEESAAEIVVLREQLAEATRRAERAEALLAASTSAEAASFLAIATEELQGSERAMRAVFTSATDALLLVDDEGRYVDANPAACALFGVGRATLLRKRVGDFVDRDSELRAFDEMLTNGSARGRCAVLRPGGTQRVAEYRWSRSIRSGLHLAVLRDVTDETAAAEALARSADELRKRDARFRAMVEKSADAVALFRDDKLTYATPHSEDLLGIAAEQLVGEKLYDLIHPDDHAEIARAVARMVESGAASVECRVVRRDGATRWVEATLTNLIDDPDVAAVVVNIRDVTERRAAAAERERLIESLTFERRRLGAVLENAPSFMAVVRGEDLVFELANKAYYDMVGERELIGLGMAEAVPEFVDQGFVAIARDVLRTGVPFMASGLPVVIARGRHSSETRFVTVTAQALVEADGTRTGVFIHGIDVTEETLAQRRVRAQFNGIPVPTYAWQRAALEAGGETDFRLLDYNDAAYRISEGKIEAYRGRSAREVFAADTDVFSDLERCIETGETFSRELERPMKSIGVMKRLLITYAPAPPDVVLAHTEDVTERRQLEEQLRQAQKMEAVGRLAGGVAHDFNNLLSVVLSYTLLMLDDLPPGHPLRPDLEEVKLAGQRAVELTRQLLAFSRQQVLQPRQMCLSETVLGLDKMLRRLLGEDVELILRTNATAEFQADPGQIEQVIMNLVINARDAMPEGGVLTVETSDETLTEASVGAPMSTPAGEYTVLTVTDTGIGMDAETRARIFEPFFTTKGPGKGTGLGLATVFGIVQQSGATIQVESEPGKGSTFRMHMPRIGQVARTTESLPVRHVHGGNETILVVEDEAPLRALAVTILRRGGYNVLSAPDGEAALAIVSSSPRPIHLLLTDVVMPRMNGRELAERVTTLRPETRTLFMSGYTDDAAVLRRVLDSSAKFLQKPLTPDALLRKVREVLDDSAVTKA